MPRNGDCYRAAGKAILSLGGDLNGRLVHGTVVGEGEPESTRHGHAWVEVDGFCFDVANGAFVAMRRSHYYRRGRVDRKLLRRYTRREAVEQILRTEHWGPWDAVFDTLK